MINKYKLDSALMKVEKPARYIGLEQNSITKSKEDVRVKFAFAFPDVYEVGMSHLGMHILYNLINNEDGYSCERVFAPWVDMEEQLRAKDIKLFSLESKTEIKDFDFLGFTLQYEMSYTNILNMLDLAGIPILAKDRKATYPIVIAGGPCAYNPEPLADFIDLFVIGEAEEITLELLTLYEKCSGKEEFLLRAATELKGIYVPKFYDVSYCEDGTIKDRIRLKDSVPMIIEKNVIENLDTMFSPQKHIVPYMETVHDRIALEIFRGCTHGCRFCQAGMIYRPIREKSIDRLIDLATKLVESTGYENISLSSLSSCDYSQLSLLVSSLMNKLEDKKVGVSLPSLRLDSFSIDVLKEIERVRKTGLTFAPEAGSQRLRDVINKGVSKEDLESAVSYAFKEGWSKIKLYFMIGLPTENDSDVMGIKELSYLVKDIFFNRPNEERKGNFSVTASASCFVPKPFTPFQWVGQTSIDEFNRRINLVKNSIKDKKVNFNYHDPRVSYLEAIIARGDRKVGKLIKCAFEKGCKFDGWSEHFRYEKWIEAMSEQNLDGYFYANRERDYNEKLPWEFINPGPTKEYLYKEYQNALSETTTPDCRRGCRGCGINDCSMWGVFK